MDFKSAAREAGIVCELFSSLQKAYLLLHDDVILFEYSGVNSSAKFTSLRNTMSEDLVWTETGDDILQDDLLPNFPDNSDSTHSLGW